MAKQTILKPGDDVPTAFLGRYSTLRADGKRPTINLCALRTETGERYFVQSETFQTNYPPMQTGNNEVLFSCKVETLPGTAKLVSDLEKDVNERLSHATSLGLPEATMADIAKMDGKPLRPTINAEGKMFFRTASDVRCYSWDGAEEYDLEQLDAGQYQLILRASNIYFGQHGQNHEPASIMWRIHQVRYQKAESPDPPTDAFLFTDPLPELPPIETILDELMPKVPMFLERDPTVEKRKVSEDRSGPSQPPTKKKRGELPKVVLSLD